MRLLFLIALVGILGSCSHSKFHKRKYTPGKFKQHSNYRVVKAENNKNESTLAESEDNEEIEFVENLNVDRDSIELDKISVDKERSNNDLYASTSDNDEFVIEESSLDLFELESINYSETYEYINVTQPTDTVYISSNDVKRARISQKQGTTSLILSLVGIPGLLLSVVGGIVLWILAIIFAAKSLRAKYNTQKGVRRAKFGLIFSIVIL